MTDPARDAVSVIDLLTRYSFDLSGYTVDRLAEYWLQRYPSDWIRLAVIEALYQGRYKAVSIEQILNLWQRRGKPLYHFNRDFERIITPRLLKGRSVQAELIVLPPPYVPPVVELELTVIEKPDLPKVIFPRPVGAIQPFAVSNSPLPKEAMFRGFYAQALEFDEAEFSEVEPPEEIPAEPAEATSCGYLGEITPPPVGNENEAVFFPEQAIAEFKPMADPALKGLPIQPFKPSGAELLTGSLETAHPIKDLGKDLGSEPIHQFVPTLPPSEFYAKLKAIVQNATTSRLTKDQEAIAPSDPSEPPAP